MNLVSLFVSGFSSATLLPGSSEVLFLLMLSERDWSPWVLILVVGSGNTLGGMSNWLIGLLAQRGLYRHPFSLSNKLRLRYASIAKRLRKHGAVVLVFSFLPVVGDPLCVVAGLLNIPWYKALGYIALGKFVRYMLLAVFPVLSG
jgi:membrane protein YqaA with SNARE-associated domain